MKPIARLFVLVFLLSMIVEPLFAVSPGFNLMAGTEIRLELLETLRSGRAKRHDVVNFKVEEDVLDENGKILIQKGTPAFGTVLNSRAAGMLGRRGALDVSADYTTAIDGQKVELKASKGKRGAGDTGLVAAGAVLVALPLAFFRGSNVTIKEGTDFKSFVSESLNVKTSYSSTSDEKLTVSDQRSEGSSTKTVKLKNGEQVTGKLLSLQNGIYVVQTSIGELRIKEGDVASIEEQPQNTSEVQKEKSSLEKKLEELKNKHK